MPTRRILAFAALAALAAGAYFALHRGPVPPAPVAVEKPPPEPQQPAPPAPAQPLETPEPPTGTRASEVAESAPLDQGSIEFPGAKVETEIDTKSPPVKLHGTLKDENTNLPLPEFDLEFEVVGGGEGPNRKVATRTDAQGNFACADPILVARCVVHFLDRPGHKRVPPPWTVDIDDVRKTEVALVVPWGASYRLAFAPKEAIDPAHVSVRLRTSGGRGPNASATEWEPVHVGDVPWVRFQPLLGNMGKPDKLEARTQDGLWAGEAPASTATGLAPGVTLISFEPRAVLEGTVVDGDGHPLGDVEVVLDCRDSNEKPVKRSSHTVADGKYRFEQLPACMGELRAVSVRHLPWSRGLTLLAGQAQQVEVKLAPLPIAGTLAVRVESESGSYTPPFSLSLALENDPVGAAGGERFERHQSARWLDEGGRKVARFEFPDLPREAFQITIQKNDFFSWDPPRLSLQPPVDETRILIRDGIPNASLAFRVKDASSGEPIPQFDLTLEFPGERDPPRRLGGRSGQSFLDHLPLERHLLWRVDAGGHALAIGDLSAFQVLEPRPDGELRVCELELQPGWGEYYRFIDSRTLAPLPGVHVLCDDVDCGASDEGGRVLVRAAAKPGRIEYRADALGAQSRPLKVDRRTGCTSDVRVATSPPKGKG